MRAIVLGSLLLVLAVPCAAQITMERVVVGPSGGTMSNGPIQMDLTIGQTAVGPNWSLSTIKADLGFWWQVVPITTDVHHGVVPTEFALRPSTPNPFSTRTAITYAVPRGPVPVFIGVFDLRGSLVCTLVNESKAPGTYTVAWDGRDNNGGFLPAGVYFTQFRAGAFQRTAKTVMLK